MNSVEGKVWPLASRGVEKDIHPAIIEILRASIELGRPYGISYINMLLRGVEDTKWLKPNHVGSAVYGALRDMPREAVTRTFHYMVDEGLMAASNPTFGTFTITDKGHAFLEKPTAVFVQGSYLKVSGREGFMYQRLRAFRAAVAEDQKEAQYQVFSDYTMDRIVMRNPESAKQLAMIPGFNDFKLEAFGEKLLAIIQEGLREHKDVAARRFQYFNSRPDHQYVKKLVEQGKPFIEISKSMTFEYKKIEGILFDLAYTKEVDIVKWIETQVHGKLLFRATEFFRKTKTRDIHTARETLQSDQVTMHLCRLYVKVMDECKEMVAKAG